MKHLIYCCLVTVAVTTTVGCDGQRLSRSLREIRALGSPARGKATNLEVHDGIGVFDDKPDYGFKVTFTVKNEGEAGTLKLMPWLNCSEGEWSRAQNIFFEKGEVQNLAYFFQEPTVNSTNIRVGVRVLPSTK